MQSVRNRYNDKNSSAWNKYDWNSKIIIEDSNQTQILKWITTKKRRLLND